MKIGLGGGCHWCTEGVFASLSGVSKVNQGWIASEGEYSAFSEAIEVHFKPEIISLATLIEIHLYTHASTSNHSMRGKYRSAIYVYDKSQHEQAKLILQELDNSFEKTLLTKILYFKSFKANTAELSDYFYTDPSRPFCQTYIHPKLKLLLARFRQHVDTDKLSLAGFEDLA